MSESTPEPIDAQNPAPGKPPGYASLAAGLFAMLLPAGVPIYLGLKQPPGEGFFLYVIAAVVALFNMGMVYTIWRWIRAQNTNSTT
ncbi:hypothetical protein [Lujinxingia litoralis]|uniref:hypothetical protein n=1 Tax=Lujinxingia litoralis TaxID=2211119 RepID=UPI0013148BC5|nr:hypothetical protein [Lujinxingia litoralis]